MKTSFSQVAAKAAGIAAAAQTFAVAQYVHAQQITADEVFGGTAGSDQAFASGTGLAQGNLTETIASLIRTAMGFLGVIAVIITLYGGFLWMTAAGNDDKVKQAKKVMISGIIGLIIVVAAYSLASFVITQLFTAVS